MSKIKAIFQYTMMIAFGIIVAMMVQSLIYHYTGRGFDMEWYYPTAIVATAFFCSFFTHIILGDNLSKLNKSQFKWRIILHFVIMFIVIMILGKLFRWYTELRGAIFVAVDIVLIYVFVWTASWWIGLIDQGRINKALDSIRDKE